VGKVSPPLPVITKWIFLLLPVRDVYQGSLCRGRWLCERWRILYIPPIWDRHGWFFIGGAHKVLVLYVPFTNNTVNFFLKFLLIHTLYILWSVFSSLAASRLLIWCTYNQNKMVKKELNLVYISQPTRPKICQKSLFGIWFIHIGLVDTSSAYISIHWKHLLWLSQVLPTLFFRNMAFSKPHR